MGDISRHLSRSEVACGCGCGFSTADYQTVLMFERARTFVGHPVRPTSWCRCHNHNEIVQKKYNKDYIPNTSKSKHLEGIACDFPTNTPKELYRFLDNLYPDSCGIGLYDWGVHFDSRPVLARWNSSSFDLTT